MLALLVVTGCVATDTDTDGDGLLDRTEARLGTDPASPDTDEDRLPDGDEAALGSDPLHPDTDGDGYLDGDEVFEGSDPLDEDSRIYTGGWPYQPFKDDIKPGDTAEIVENRRLGRFSREDQYGDVVDLYDFYGDGRDVMLHFCSLAGPYCEFVPRVLANEQSVLRDAIVRGDIHFLTIVHEGVNRGDPPASSDAKRWADGHPGFPGPSLVDHDLSMTLAVQIRYTPTVVLLDEELRVLSDATAQDYVVAMDSAVERLDQRP